MQLNDPHVETPGEVVSRVEHAMKYLLKERITLNPNCRFSTSNANTMDLDEAYQIHFILRSSVSKPL